MNTQIGDRYEDDLQYYFLIQIQQDGSVMYVYNRRTFVRDMQFARRFETRRSARRCIHLAGLKNYNIIKIKRRP